ncbi:MAG: hypothetical protein TEF_06765 [Rhizobiales bacterium NRL2]|jgi:murein L,D-transpeptidase YcbB/YkuD|nr:MAG: hypothetical protein TEF_06765 [Rhizobiales bacterium NRL2]
MLKGKRSSIFALLVCLLPAPALAQNAVGGDCGPADGEQTAFIRDGAVSRALHARLNACGPFAVDGHALDRQALAAFYRDRGYQPLWVGEQGALPAARTLLEQIRKADRDLLQPGDYAPDAIAARLDAQRPAGLAELELLASHAFAEYGVDLDRGSVSSEMNFLNDAVAPRDASYGSILDRAAGAASLERFVRDRRDLNPIYVGLRDGLPQLRREQEAQDRVTIPDGPVVARGERDERVPLLRQRLGLQPPQDASESDLYTADLAQAVERFQQANGLAADGLLGPNTRAVLNTSLQDRVRIARLNLERARWLPREMGERHIVVDIPGFRVRLFEDGRQVASMRAIVGQEYNRTPPFADRAEYIQVNPYWNVPNSILTNEIAPKMLDDPGYLAENNMEVLSGWGGGAHVLDPSRVNWRAASRGDAGFRVRQRPGPENALGQVKFMFPNRYSIYLHDTPHQELFEKSRRTFSHGCIRVEEPMRLAEFLLQDTSGAGREDVARLIASGERERIGLDARVPVYITYFTAWPAADGSIEFRPDVYGRDAELRDQMFE